MMIRQQDALPGFAAGAGIGAWLITGLPAAGISVTVLVLVGNWALAGLRRTEAPVELSADVVKARRCVLIMLTALALTGMTGMSRDYLHPYSSPLGQAVMLLIVAAIVAAMVWLVRLVESAASQPLTGGGAAVVSEKLAVPFVGMAVGFTILLGYPAFSVMAFG